MKTKEEVKKSSSPVALTFRSAAAPCRP